MSDDFKAALETVSQWIADYHENRRDYPVRSAAKPGDVLKQIPVAPPIEEDSFERIFQDFKQIILPGVTHWQHPRFFGYFPSNSSPPSILAEMLIASLGVQCMSWASSPAATELEVRVMGWLREAMGLSADFSGVIQDSASSSTLIAIVVAREKISNFMINEGGYENRKLVAYCSSEAHSSIEKAAKIAGIGRRYLRKIPVDSDQRMRTDFLERAIEEDKQQGMQPFFVVGAFGTTSSTAIDDLSEIAKISKRHGLWFHVDAAYAGSALVLPEIRPLARGICDADSVVVNPHKWLLTTFDCSALFIKAQDLLIRTFEILPEYLKTPECESVINFRDWSLGLGRRFRSLKLWFVFRWYGLEQIYSLLRNHILLAERLENWIKEDARFEIVARRHFNLVCFRLKASDEKNKQLLAGLNESGKLFLTHTRLNDQYVLRLVVGQTDVTEEDVQGAWQEIQRVATLILGDTRAW